MIIVQLDSEQLSTIIQNSVRRVLNESLNKKNESSDKWFDLTGLCNYLPDKPAKPTVYGWVNNGLIPYHKTGKRLRFLKSDIDNWLNQGRRKTTEENKADAIDLIKKKGGINE